MTNYTVHILILPESYADIKAALPKGKFPFKPGMSSSVEIQTNRLENVLSVPVNAVTTREWSDSAIKKINDKSITDAARQVVFVFNKATQKVLLKDVKTGLQDNTYLQITEGVTEQDEVVIAPYGAIARLLKDNDEVKVVEKDKLFETKKKD